MNPELKRLLLTACRWQRLLFTIFVGAALQQTGLLLDGLADGDEDFFHFWFFAAAGIWGSYCIIEAVAAEHRQNTWYWQMMMPLTPLQITIGKFLGAILIPWLGALIIIAPALFVDGQLTQTPTVLTQALMSNCLALLLSMVLSNHQRGALSVFFVLVIAVAFPFIPKFDLLPFGQDATDYETVFWYGRDWQAERFLHGSFLFYGFWAFIGAWQHSRKNKQYRITPLLWIIFLCGHIAYVYGFVSERAVPTLAQAADGNTLLIFIFVAQFLLISAAYVAAFLGGNRVYEIQPLLSALAQRRWWRAWQNLPAWSVAFFLFILAMAINLLTSELSDSTRWFIIAYSLYAVRDIALLLLFTLKPHNRFAEGLTIVHLAILYFLIPALLDLSGLPNHWLTPDFETVQPLSAASAAAQAAAALIALWFWRLRTLLRTAASPDRN